MNNLLTTEDTLLLDEMLAHEVGCEARHVAFGNLVCSGPVTHRYQTLCGLDKLVCANSATYTRWCIDGLGHRVCALCKNATATCWKVTPA